MKERKVGWGLLKEGEREREKIYFIITFVPLLCLKNDKLILQIA
jgi:hypothetical protein